MNEIRAVIDSGVVVSAVLLPRSIPRQAFDIAAERGRLLVSTSTVVELEEVMRRSKFNRYIEERQRLEFLAALIDRSEVIEIVETVSACRDPKDDKFLEVAVNGRADYLITGDADLLALNPFRATSIVTPQVFVAEMSRAQP